MKRSSLYDSLFLRVISIILLITFISSDIARAYPDAGKVSVDTLATGSVNTWKDADEQRAGALGRYIKGLVAKDLKGLPVSGVRDKLQNICDRFASNTGIKVDPIRNFEHQEVIVPLPGNIILRFFKFQKGTGSGVIPYNGFVPLETVPVDEDIAFQVLKKATEEPSLSNLSKRMDPASREKYLKSIRELRAEYRKIRNENAQDPELSKLYISGGLLSGFVAGVIHMLPFLGNASFPVAAVFSSTGVVLGWFAHETGHKSGGKYGRFSRMLGGPLASFTGTLIFSFSALAISLAGHSQNYFTAFLMVLAVNFAWHMFADGQILLRKSDHLLARYRFDHVHMNGYKLMCETPDVFEEEEALFEKLEKVYRDTAHIPDLLDQRKALLEQMIYPNINPIGSSSRRLLCQRIAVSLLGDRDPEIWRPAIEQLVETLAVADQSQNQKFFDLFYHLLIEAEALPNFVDEMARVYIDAHDGKTHLLSVERPVFIKEVDKIFMKLAADDPHLGERLFSKISSYGGREWGYSVDTSLVENRAIRLFIKYLQTIENIPISDDYMAKRFCENYFNMTIEEAGEKSYVEEADYGYTVTRVGIARLLKMARFTRPGVSYENTEKSDTDIFKTLSYGEIMEIIDNYMPSAGRDIASAINSDLINEDQDRVLDRTKRESARIKRSPGDEWFRQIGLNTDMLLYKIENMMAAFYSLVNVSSAETGLSGGKDHSEIVQYKERIGAIIAKLGELRTELPEMYAGKSRTGPAVPFARKDETVLTIVELVDELHREIGKVRRLDLMSEFKDLGEEYLGTIESAIENLSLAYIRTASFVRSGGGLNTRGHVETIDVNFSIRLAKAGLGRKGSGVILLLGEVLPVEGDELLLYEVWDNLISNGLHAMEWDGPLTINTTLSQDGGEVVVRVVDEGEGIGPERLSSIFEPHYTTKKNEGRIGLSICREIIENMDGSISVDSEPGKGTTVEVRLPVAEGDAVERGELAKELIKDLRKGADLAGALDTLIEHKEKFRDSPVLVDDFRKLREKEEDITFSYSAALDEIEAMAALGMIKEVSRDNIRTFWLEEGGAVFSPENLAILKALIGNVPGCPGRDYLVKIKELSDMFRKKYGKELIESVVSDEPLTETDLAEARGYLLYLLGAPDEGKQGREHMNFLLRYAEKTGDVHRTPDLKGDPGKLAYLRAHSTGTAALVEKLFIKFGFGARSSAMAGVIAAAHDTGKAVNEDKLELHYSTKTRKEMTAGERRTLNEHTADTLKVLSERGVKLPPEAVIVILANHDPEARNLVRQVNRELWTGLALFSVADRFRALVEDRPYERDIYLKDADSVNGWLARLHSAGVIDDEIARMVSPILIREITPAKGHISEAFTRVMLDFAREPFTRADFRRKRVREDGKPFSDRTIASELEGLVSVGVLDVTTKGRKKEYILREEVARAPPGVREKVQFLLRALPARPDREKLLSYRSLVKRILQSYPAEMTAEAAESYFRTGDREAFIRSFLEIWPTGKIPLSVKKKVDELLESTVHKRHLERSIRNMSVRTFAGGRVYAGKLLAVFSGGTGVISDTPEVSGRRRERIEIAGKKAKGLDKLAEFLGKDYVFKHWTNKVSERRISAAIWRAFRALPEGTGWMAARYFGYKDAEEKFLTSGKLSGEEVAEEMRRCRDTFFSSLPTEVRDGLNEKYKRLIEYRKGLLEGPEDEILVFPLFLETLWEARAIFQKMKIKEDPVTPYENIEYKPVKVSETNIRRKSVFEKYLEKARQFILSGKLDNALRWVYRAVRKKRLIPEAEDLRDRINELDGIRKEEAHARYLRIAELYFREEKSVREIARLKGISAADVRDALRRLPGSFTGILPRSARERLLEDNVLGLYAVKAKGKVTVFTEDRLDRFIDELQGRKRRLAETLEKIGKDDVESRSIIDILMSRIFAEDICEVKVLSGGGLSFPEYFTRGLSVGDKVVLFADPSTKEITIYPAGGITGEEETGDGNGNAPPGTGSLLSLSPAVFAFTGAGGFYAVLAFLLAAGAAINLAVVFRAFLARARMLKYLAATGESAEKDREMKKKYGVEDVGGRDSISVAKGIRIFASSSGGNTWTGFNGATLPYILYPAVFMIKSLDRFRRKAGGRISHEDLLKPDREHSGDPLMKAVENAYKSKRRYLEGTTVESSIKKIAGLYRRTASDSSMRVKRKQMLRDFVFFYISKTGMNDNIRLAAENEIVALLDDPEGRVWEPVFELVLQETAKAGIDNDEKRFSLFYHLLIRSEKLKDMIEKTIRIYEGLLSGRIVPLEGNSGQLARELENILARMGSEDVLFSETLSRGLADFGDYIFVPVVDADEAKREAVDRFSSALRASPRLTIGGHDEAVVFSNNYFGISVSQATAFGLMGISADGSVHLTEKGAEQLVSEAESGALSYPEILELTALNMPELRKELKEDAEARRFKQLVFSVNGIQHEIANVLASFVGVCSLLEETDTGVSKEFSRLSGGMESIASRLRTRIEALREIIHGNADEEIISLQLKDLYGGRAVTAKMLYRSVLEDLFDLKNCLKELSAIDINKEYTKLGDDFEEIAAGAIISIALTYCLIESFLRSGGGMDLVGKPFPVDIEKIILLAGLKYSKRSVDVELFLEGVPAVKADELLMLKVILNLLKNASQAQKWSGKIKINSFLDKDKNEVVVTVTDEGEGIRPELADRIFDPYFTTKEKGEGTGIGLPISREAVEKAGGTLTFETEYGKGTKFIIRLPALRNVEPVDGIISQMIERYYRGSDHPDSFNIRPRGDLLNGFETIRRENRLRKSGFTRKEFMEFRKKNAAETFKYTTVASELEGLVKLGILEADRSEKPYSYRLTRRCSRAPPSAISKLLVKLGKLPAFPADEELEIIRGEIDRDIFSDGAVELSEIEKNKNIILYFIEWLPALNLEIIRLSSEKAGLAASLEKERVSERLSRRLSAVRAELKQKNSDLANISGLKGPPSYPLRITSGRNMRLEASRKLKKAVELIADGNEPAASVCIMSALRILGDEFTAINNHGKKSFKKRVWLDSDGMRNVLQGKYRLRQIPGGEKVKVKHRDYHSSDTTWQALRSQDRGLDAILEETSGIAGYVQRIHDINAFMEEKREGLSRDRKSERYQPEISDQEKEEILSLASDLEAKCNERLRVPEKRVALGSAHLVRELAEIGEYRAAAEILETIGTLLEARKSSLEQQIEAIYNGRLRELREAVHSRNSDLLWKTRKIWRFLDNGDTGSADRWIFGILRDGEANIAGEPEFAGMLGLLKKVQKDHIASGNAEGAKKAIEVFGNRVKTAELLNGFMQDLRDEWVHSKLQGLPADYKSIFISKYNQYLDFARKNNIGRGSPRLLWTLFYQAAFVSMNAKDPERPSKKVEDPLFTAFSAAAKILEADDTVYMAEVLKNTAKNKYSRTINALESLAARGYPAVSGTGPQEMEELLSALSQDLGLDDGRSRELMAVAYVGENWKAAAETFRSDVLWKYLLKRHLIDTQKDLEELRDMPSPVMEHLYHQSLSGMARYREFFERSSDPARWTEIADKNDEGFIGEISVLPGNGLAEMFLEYFPDIAKEKKDLRNLKTFHPENRDDLKTPSFGDVYGNLMAGLRSHDPGTVRSNWEALWILREWIYRHWDGLPKERSYEVFKRALERSGKDAESGPSWKRMWQDYLNDPKRINKPGKQCDTFGELFAVSLDPGSWMEYAEEDWEPEFIGKISMLGRDELAGRFLSYYGPEHGEMKDLRRVRALAEGKVTLQDIYLNLLNITQQKPSSRANGKHHRQAMEQIWILREWIYRHWDDNYAESSAREFLPPEDGKSGSIRALHKRLERTDIGAERKSVMYLNSRDFPALTGDEAISVIAAATGWNLPRVPNERSIYAHLIAPEEDGGRCWDRFYVKGVHFDENSPVAPHAGPSNEFKGYDPYRMLVDGSGKLYSPEPEPSPDGAMEFSKAEKEFDLHYLMYHDAYLRENGIYVAAPVGYGFFPDAVMDPEHEERWGKLGFLVLGLDEEMPSSRMNRLFEPVEQSAAKVERLAYALRRLHEAGYIHPYLHSGNVSVKGKKTYIHDLDHAEHIELCPSNRRRIIASQIRDIFYVYSKIMQEIQRSFGIRRNGESALARDIMLIALFGAYFHDLSEEEVYDLKESCSEAFGILARKFYSDKPNEEVSYRELTGMTEALTGKLQKNLYIRARRSFPGRGEKPISSDIEHAPDHRFLNALIKVSIEEGLAEVSRRPSLVSGGEDAEVYIFSPREVSPPEDADEEKSGEDAESEKSPGTKAENKDVFGSFKDLYDHLDQEKREKVREYFEEMCDRDHISPVRKRIMYYDGIEKLSNVAGHAGVAESRIFVVEAPDLDTLIKHEMLEMFLHQRWTARQAGFESWDEIDRDKRAELVSKTRYRERILVSAKIGGSKGIREEYLKFALKAHKAANMRYPVPGPAVLPDHAKKKYTGEFRQIFLPPLMGGARERSGSPRTGESERVPGMHAGGNIGPSLQLFEERAVRADREFRAGRIFSPDASRAQYVSVDFLLEQSNVDFPDNMGYILSEGAGRVLELAEKIYRGEMPRSGILDHPVRIEVRPGGKIWITEGLHRLKALYVLGVRETAAHVIYRKNAPGEGLPFRDISPGPENIIRASFLPAVAFFAGSLYPLTAAALTAGGIGLSYALARYFYLKGYLETFLS
ncbi:MAG: HD domain-containing protein, partial [Candidatus Omnitrophica bacterium]|nr:HD domain-containing protein [Candidatus Omnitrophota bacterium]